ncbi:MAG: N-6 DNA methylase, partial [Bacilli bacterium]
MVRGNEKVTSFTLPALGFIQLGGTNERLQQSLDIQTWKTVLSWNSNIGKKLDEVFAQIVTIIRNSHPEAKVWSSVSFTDIPDATLKELLIEWNGASLSYEEFQDTAICGPWFSALLETTLTANRKATGEMVFPESLSQLMINILAPKKGSFYDGVAATGGTLVQAHCYNSELELYGQEMQSESVLFAYLNALANGIDISEIHVATGDTLFEPAHIEGENLKTFDYIAMRSLFGRKLEDVQIKEYDVYGRFSSELGRTGKMHGDLAYLQHAIISMNETGRAAVVVPSGVLHRGSKPEADFRKYVVENDFIEAIVALPRGLFTWTAIAPVLLMFNKKKNVSDKVVFVNAEEMGTTVRGTTTFTEQDIESIVTVIQKCTATDFAKVVSKEDIVAEDYVLQPKTYFESQSVLSSSGEYVVHKDVYRDQVRNKVRIGDFAELIRGANLPAKAEITTGKQTYPTIQLKDVVNGELQTERFEQFPIVNAERYFAQTGDILVASRGTVVKFAVVPELDAPTVVSNMFVCVRIRNCEQVLPAYVK